MTASMLISKNVSSSRAFPTETLTTLPEAVDLSMNLPVHHNTDCTHIDLNLVMFNVLSSAKSYKRVLDFMPLWWHPGLTATVWLDDLPNETASIPSWLRERMSISSARTHKWWEFTKRDYHTRLAWTIVDAYRESLRKPGKQVDWFLVIDDDTIVFTDNLAAILSKYDPTELVYIGNWSEDQTLLHQHSKMAFGGGGYVISRALAALLSVTMEFCLPRYNHLYGQDARVSACTKELGVHFSREEGFHQLDLKGDVSGLLEAHPAAPVISLHHLQMLRPVFPHFSMTASLQRLMVSSSVFGTAFLQQFVAMDVSHDWTFAFAHGYSVRWFHSLVPPSTLRKVEVTFSRVYGGKMTGSKDWTMDNRNPTPRCFDYSLFYWEPGSGSTSDDGGDNWQYYRRHREGLCNLTMGVVDGISVSLLPGVGTAWRTPMKLRRLQLAEGNVEVVLLGVLQSVRLRFHPLHPVSAGGVGLYRYLERHRVA